MKTVMINASPKTKGSVSGHILNIQRIMLHGTVVKEKLRTQGDHDRILEQLRDVDAVLFSLPLYVDGVPSHVLAFMEKMEAFCREHSLKLQLYVLCNSGFIEGNQNRALMRVFENFCHRCKIGWGGGIGIGGGVMMNVMRILVLVYSGILLLNILMGNVQGGMMQYGERMLVMLFFHLGIFWCMFRTGLAMRKGKAAGVQFTRVLLPSFIFILLADFFFVLISLFQGGLFRGWLKKK